MAINYGRGPWAPSGTDPFFEGWAIKPSLEAFSLLLQQSDAVFFASDEKSGEIVGFLTAHTDWVMSAYISFIEVAPNYRAQGVGTALLKMALPAVYENGAGATRSLHEAGFATDDARTFTTTTAHRQFQHLLMICEALASLDVAVRADPHLRFIAWPQILARAPGQTRTFSIPFRVPVPSGGYLVPDGLFGLEYAHGGTKAYRFFALEADRGTMPVARTNPNQTSYLGKIAAYREIIAGRVHKTHLGLPNLLVLTLTTGEARMADIIRRLGGQTGDSAAFLFKSVDASGLTAPAPQLLLEPWQRAGSQPLRIADASGPG